MTKSPPHDVFIEQVVIGAMLVNPEVAATIKATLIPDNFYRDAHKIIMETAISLNGNIDYASVATALKTNGKLEQCGGIDYLTSLADEIAITAGIQQHIRTIKNLSARRNIINNAMQCAEKMYDLDSDYMTSVQEFGLKIKDHLAGPNRLSQEVREWVENEANGVFYMTEIYKNLGIMTKYDKNNVSQVLSRLSKEGLVERALGRNGCFRKINYEYDLIDWKSEKTDFIDLTFPLGIHRWVHFMPKNIICIAGSPDSGKTALLLNIVMLNQRKHEVWYFSSEMGAMELRSRLENFDDYDKIDWRFNAVERASDFADIIHPDAINVIDFLEIGDAFYKVADMIGDIYKKLKTGIAVIAIQKNKGSELGRGGSFSLEKPRLYMTLDSVKPRGNVIKIVKAKNWRDSMLNPNGQALKFKIVRGCNLIQTGSWDLEIE